MDMSYPFLRKSSRHNIGMARMGEKMWRKYGALDYKECVGDDLKPKWGAPFPRMMNLRPDVDKHVRL